MKVFASHILAAAILLCTPCASAQRDADAPEGLAYALARSLTSEVGARLAGTEAEARARAWAVVRLQQLGFENVRVEPFEIDGWERGEERVELLGAAAQRLVATTLGGSVATPRAGVEAPIALVNSFVELLAAPEGAFDGRIVFINERTARTRDGAGYGLAVRGRSAGPSEAARRGARALLIRSIGTGSDRFAHAGLLSYADDTPRIPAAAISAPDADQIERLSAAGASLRVRIVLRPRATGRRPSGNVVADIVGAEKPDEIVLLAAHLDSWDLGTGALDDAAGVGLVMEAALRAARNARPRRTIRVVLYGAEEVAGGGGRAYAELHANETHVVATEADFGAAPVWGFFTNVPEDELPFYGEVARALAPLGVEQGHNRASGGEDIRPLRRRGIPVVSLVQDGSAYFDYHHTDNDTFDKIDPAALEQNVEVFARFAAMAANR